MLKEALRVPKAIKPKTVKNVITDTTGKTLGRVHVGVQDFSKIALKKMKGLRKRPAGGRDDADADAEQAPDLVPAAAEDGPARKRGRRGPPALDD